MKTRPEIKTLAKQRFKAQYTPALLTGLLLIAIAVVGGLLAMFGVGILLYAAEFLFVVFSARVFVFVWNEKTVSLGDMFRNAFDNLGRKLGGIAWMYLWTFLWSLLLCVPGIIKFFSYAMTPYILAEHQDVPAKDALKISMRMMNGHKAELFVVMLSFIGWYLLSGITFGILMIFWVQPYFSATIAGYYTELKRDCLEKGVITEAELGASYTD